MVYIASQMGSLAEEIRQEGCHLNEREAALVDQFEAAMESHFDQPVASEDTTAADSMDAVLNQIRATQPRLARELRANIGKVICAV